MFPLSPTKQKYETNSKVVENVFRLLPQQQDLRDSGTISLRKKAYHLPASPWQIAIDGGYNLQPAMI